MEDMARPIVLQWPYCMVAGKQIAFIVAGPLSQIPNITEIFQVFFELLDANMVGFISDEYGDSRKSTRCWKTWQGGS